MSSVIRETLIRFNKKRVPLLVDLRILSSFWSDYFTLTDKTTYRASRKYTETQHKFIKKNILVLNLVGGVENQISGIWLSERFPWYASFSVLKSCDYSKIFKFVDKKKGNALDRKRWGTEKYNCMVEKMKFFIVDFEFEFREIIIDMIKVNF